MILNRWLEADEHTDVITYLNDGTVRVSEARVDNVVHKTSDCVSIPSIGSVFVPMLNCDNATLNHNAELSVLSELGSHDDLVQKTIQTIKDTGTLLSYELNAWSRDGMNSYDILNTSFITNMREETDKCVDIISYKEVR